MDSQECLACTADAAAAYRQPEGPPVMAGRTPDVHRSAMQGKRKPTLRGAAEGLLSARAGAPLLSTRRSSELAAGGLGGDRALPLALDAKVGIDEPARDLLPHFEALHSALIDTAV